jgi:hypothetical protein
MDPSWPAAPSTGAVELSSSLLHQLAGQILPSRAKVIRILVATLEDTLRAVNEVQHVPARLTRRTATVAGYVDRE